MGETVAEPCPLAKGWLIRSLAPSAGMIDNTLAHMIDETLRKAKSFASDMEVLEVK
jgi:hypothetical protein